MTEEISSELIAATILEDELEYGGHRTGRKPTIAQGQYIPNLASVQKEVDDYFSINQRIKYYAILDHLIDKGWELQSKEIEEMLELKLPRRKIGTDYDYGSYRFRYLGKQLWQPYKNQVDLYPMDLNIPLPSKLN